MSQSPFQPRSGSSPGHFGHAHFWERFHSRRQFLQAAGAAGIALGSGLCWPERALAGDNPPPPKPIPGGVTLFGHFVHAHGIGPVDKGNEVSWITDFNGLVGDCRITGTGKGTGFAKPLLFVADMGFMKGVYVGEDGKHHRGTFAFI
jgi:hypothetical protein